MIISYSLISCRDQSLDKIIKQLCSSTCCCTSSLTACIEADGNNLQPLAEDLCCIDPIALIKVVYREKTATNDGWLLVITQQPTSITPLTNGELTQSMKVVHNRSYFYSFQCLCDAFRSCKEKWQDGTKEWER